MKKIIADGTPDEGDLMIYEVKAGKARPLDVHKLRLCWDGLDVEPFRKEVVEEYLNNKNSFNKFPLRHYNQLELTFDEDILKVLLNRLDIPIANIATTIFGGYTGQFTNCLRNIGTQVIFTDPLEEWVRKAIDSGFEAYKYTAEEIPKDIVKRTDLFATFECYSAFVEPRSSYTVLRFLTSKFGILFAESKRTRDKLKREGAKTGLKNSFLPFSEIYFIRRVSMEKEGIRLYNFCSNEKNRKIIGMDCKIMKFIHDHSPHETYLDKKNVFNSADEMGMNEEEFLCSLKRILDLYQTLIPQPLKKHIPSNMFAVLSKVFHVDLRIFQ